MSTGRRIRQALATGTVGACLLVGAPASALDKNDIINMQAAGLGAEVIVSVIRSSTEPLTISPAEVDELRVAGIPVPVLDEICLRVGCGSPTAPVGPSGPVGPDLQRELELRRQQEEARMQLEQQRMEAERQRMREQIEAEQSRQAQLTSAFQGLVEAERFERAGDMTRAAMVYKSFLDEVRPAPGSLEYATGLSGFVRTMHASGYRHAIRAQALEAVLLGPSNEDFAGMVRALMDVSAEAQFMDPQFERMTEFSVGNFDQEFQDEWNYFLGRFFWVYGQFPRATEFLGRVSDGSPRAAQSHYLGGVIALEQQQNREAYTEFQQAILSTERNGSDRDVWELAQLAIARLAYETANNDVALFHYRKIPATSARHTRAVFESAWTYLMKQDWNRAVGTLHALHSPYYDTWFFPELRVMEAFAYLQTCDLAGAQEAVLAHDREVDVLQEPLNAFIAETTEPQAYYEAIARYYDVQGTPDAVPLPIEAVRHVLANVDFVNEMELIGHLEAESARLAERGADLGAFGAAALADIEAELRMKKIRAGLAVSSMLTSFRDDLTNWNVRAQEVGIEVRTEMITAVDTALAGHEIRGEARTSVFVMAADWQYWPFEGEYWADEVDNYRADLIIRRDDETGRCLLADESATGAP